jgi:ribonuclease BN (tRNA processing enzyme)
MEIILLGTGTAIPFEQHSPAGLVVTSEGFSFLMDIGPGTISRLATAGFSTDLIDTLLLTHLHPDHTLDLATLMQIFDSAPNARRSNPFHIIGCRGTQDFYERLLGLYPAITPETYTVDVREVFRDEFKCGGLKIRCVPTGHTPVSVAYRIEDGKHSVVYSGDAVKNGELCSLSSGADVLICECSFPAGWETPDHMNADGVGRLVKQAGVKKLVVTHRYPPALAVDIRSQIQKHFDGDIVLAVDGMHLTV